MVQEKLKKIVIVCGPTAVGKTSVANQLARRFEGEIVNADSGQVWRGLDVGTAKPGQDVRSKVPHHLFDVVGPEEHFDASLFVKLADEAVGDISGRGRNVFVVGGTGMYIRMLVHGMCDAPPRNQKLRDKLEKEIGELGIEGLHVRLSEIDPVSAKVVHHNDKTRIIRALEIFEATGIAASEFYRQHRFAQRRYDSLKIGLDVPRDELYKRIEDRVDLMLSRGWADEVKRLHDRYGAGCQAFSAIGYRELALFAAGEIGIEECVSLIKRNSRRFAKRQLTWFRADNEVQWYSPTQISVMADEVAGFLGSN